MSMMTNGDGRRGDQTYLRDFWRFIQRNRLLIVGIPLVTLLATGAFVQLATPIYEGDVQLRVDDDRGALPVLDVLKSLAPGGNKVHTEIGVLRTRAIAEDVVDSLSLHVTVRSPRRVPRSVLFREVTAARTAPEGRYRLERVGDGFRVAGAGGARGGQVARPWAGRWR
jgi:uncharacterized protein involved in exopolysaccharide biosynthesis